MLHNPERSTSRATAPFALARFAVIVVLTACSESPVQDRVETGATATNDIEVVASPTAPDWAIPYGGEFWRRPTLAHRASSRQEAAGAHTLSDIDLGDAIDRVSHAIEHSTQQGPPRVRSLSYTASYDDGGLLFASDASTELRLRTTSVSLADAVLDPRQARPAGWAFLGNTAQRSLGHGVIEHHEARSEGVELTWIVKRPTAGPLVVDVEVTGLIYAGQTDQGVHYADLSGTPRVRVSSGVLVDAVGGRWDLAPEPTDSGIRWRVDEAILAQVTFPVALDPTVSAELGMDTPVSSVGAAGTQGSPTVAFNGTDYLVAWHDERSELDYDIYATRVSSTGLVHDVDGIVIASGPGNQAAPTAACLDTECFVAWHDAQFDGTSAIHGTRVTATGAVRDPSGLVIAPARSSAPSIAASSSEYFVTWWDGASRSTHGTRISAGGTIQDVPAVVVGPPESHSAVVASNRTDFFVAWAQNTADSAIDIRGTRVSASGQVLDVGGIAIATAPLSQRFPAIASDGTGYLVVWQNARSGSNDDIRGSRVSNMGVVLDAGGIPIRVSSGAYEGYPAVASNGSQYLVAWVESSSLGGRVFGSRVSLGGIVLDPSGFPVSSGMVAGQPGIASNGVDYLISWGESQTDDVFGRRVSGSGSPIDSTDVLYSMGPNAQYAASVASNGSDYFAVWRDFRAGDWDIYGARLSESGAVLDPAGVPVAVGAGEPIEASVASNGTDYFVVWRSLLDADIYGTRVSSAGEVLDAGGVSICDEVYSQSHPRVASNGTDYLVVWDDYRIYGRMTVFANRVSGGGVVLDGDGIALSPAGAASWYFPRVASNGRDYLIVWQGAGSGYIRAARVSAAGVALDPIPFVVSMSPDDQVLPAVASNGDDYFVVWERRPSGGDSDIVGARVTAGGLVLDPSGIQVSNTPQYLTRPVVASDGRDYFAAWQSEVLHTGRGADVYGARITGAGAVMDPSAVALSTTARNEEAAELAYNAATGGYLVTYDVGYRIRARLVERDCGNGVVDPEEACDDDGGRSGDGCDGWCAAEPGFRCTGSPSLCVDIDECAEGTSGCHAQAACVNVPGGFVCTCAPGYGGDGITCFDVDECASGTHDCDLHASCTNAIGTHSCACNAGYSGDGFACADIDECATGAAGCSADAICTNIPGAFVCTCAAGYGGDGIVCADIDECATGSAACASNALCTNTRGGFECACNPGYVGDGFACADIDECAEPIGPCGADATCSNSPGAFMCACNDGYQGDGSTCIDIDECGSGSADCDANATCANTPGGFDCTCDGGFEGDGRSCTAVELDAGRPDEDAGPTVPDLDGGTDAGLDGGRDAGSERDASVADDAGTVVEGGGCGCRAAVPAGRPPGWGIVCALGLCLLGFRKRGVRTQPG